MSPPPPPNYRAGYGPELWEIAYKTTPFRTVLKFVRFCFYNSLKTE